MPQESIASTAVHFKTTMQGRSVKSASTLTVGCGVDIYLAFVFRIPHSPRNDHKSIWSIAFTHDLQTRTSTCFFDGVSKHDLQELEEFFDLEKTRLHHPLSMLCFLAELLSAYYTEMKQHDESQLWYFEKTLGITRGEIGRIEWGWSEEMLRDSIERCYRLNVGPVYLERRLTFLISLQKFLLDQVEDCEANEFQHLMGDSNFIATHRLLKQELRNSLGLTKNQLHQVLCLQKRIQTQMSTVSEIAPEQ